MRDLFGWLAIAFVAIFAVIAFKMLAATKFGAKIPGYAELAATI